MTTHLYLIRHGEAFTNVERIFGGINGCRGLTLHGRAQAHALAAYLGSSRSPIKADVLYASTLPRARETARIVAPALKLNEDDIRWDDALHELREGVADGMYEGDALQQYPGFGTVHAEVFTPVAPEGESWARFQLRVSEALERLIASNLERRIVVICHGGVIEASFFHLMQLPPQLRSRNSFGVHNTAITHWRRRIKDGRIDWHLNAHNDYRHLQDLEG
jgi:probable phosphoglycerate mutase